MDKVVQKLTAMGVPGLIILAIAATTGLTGGAAIVTALAVAGGPFGIMGGIAAMAALALAVDAIAEYGFEKIGQEVVKNLQKDGMSKKDIRNKIDSYTLVSDSLKNKLYAIL